MNEEAPPLKETEPLDPDYGNKLLEFVLWTGTAFLVSLRFWTSSFSSLFGKNGIDDPASWSFDKRLDYFSNSLFLAVMIVVFPVVFKVIFGVSPFMFVRSALQEKKDLRFAVSNPLLIYKSEKRPLNETKSHPSEIPKASDNPGTEPEIPTIATSDELLSEYIRSSSKIAKDIYTRSNIYLLVGVMVAFSGLVFFYFQTARTPPIDATPTTAESPLLALPSSLLTLAPRFGMLFFIEFIAFFFLRQYRSAMSEFTYFEALKRRREELRAALTIIRETGKEIDAIALLNANLFYSTAGKIGKGESTELLESKKLDKDELELFERIVQVIGNARKG